MNLVLAFDALKEIAQLLGITVKSRRDVAQEYKAQLFDFTNKTMRGRMSITDMARAHRGLIRTLAPAMYDEALKANGIDPQEKDSADQAEIDGWIATQLPYVRDFADATASAKDESAKNDIANRIDIWVAALVALGQLAYASAQRNAMVTWRLGKTEQHCHDEGNTRGCLQLDGQRHRVAWFISKGLIPREPASDSLTCGGWACECGCYDDSGKRIL